MEAFATGTIGVMMLVLGIVFGIELAEGTCKEYLLKTGCAYYDTQTGEFKIKERE